MISEDQRTAAVERWGSMVWRLALARMANVHDAEDLFQEVFLRYFRHEAQLESDEHRRAWLIRCTLNRAKSAHSAPWRHRVLPLDVAVEIGVRDDRREVYAAVLSLPEKYRTVVHLHYFEGLTIAEIAAQMNCAEGTVKAQLHRARAQLKDALGDIEL
ncbi:MAG: sigma-70 family RNA polymerase sigma factor [Clostridia bacterium]|nr:sigma-70 family RNA polymerase sigma factor [Clostridia bacterium]